MNYIIKKASSLTVEEQTIRGILGIPDDWAIEKYSYVDSIPEGFELISEEDLQILIDNNQVSYDAWLQSLRPIAPVPSPERVIMSNIDIDSEGRQVTRTATAKSGWSILVHGIEIETSNLTGLYSKDYLGNNVSGLSTNFYDISGTELITQEDIDLYCTRTTMLFKPSFDYEVLGGQLHQSGVPISDLRLSAIGGIIELGGVYVKELIRGVNFKYIDLGDHITIDGKTTKLMKKDIVGVPYQGNQVKIILDHAVGFKHKIMLVLNYYRA